MRRNKALQVIEHLVRFWEEPPTQGDALLFPFVETYDGGVFGPAAPPHHIWFKYRELVDRVKEHMAMAALAPPPRFGAVAVIVQFDPPCILMGRAGERSPAPGHLIFPGGKIEPGETCAGCAIREAKEETGLDIEILEQIGAFETHGRTGHHYAVAFLARATGGKLRESAEFLEPRWMYIGQALAMREITSAGPFATRDILERLVAKPPAEMERRARVEAQEALKKQESAILALAYAHGLQHSREKGLRDALVLARNGCRAAMAEDKTWRDVAQAGEEAASAALKP